MGTVALIWIVQLGLLLYAVLNNADWAGFAERLRNVFRSPVVWILVLGCAGFLRATSSAAAALDYVGATYGWVSFCIEGLLLIGVIGAILFRRLLGAGGIDLTFGSAQSATPAHAEAQGILGESGLPLGYLESPDPDEARHDRETSTVRPLHYTGERHLIVVAPTRAGKGVSVIVPQLLKTTDRSCIVIDPKGENVAITHDHRAKGTRPVVLDPWRISDKPVARFNPLDTLRADSASLVDDALGVAEALVVEESGDGTARHFADQATDLIKGIIMHVVTDPDEAKTRTLGRVRDILTSTPKELAQVGMAMARSPQPAIVAAAAMIVGKTDAERSGVFSTAQRNTHFLDSPAMRASLAASDFDFAALKAEPVSVYICLPVERLSSHGRWLRLLIALAISALARTPSRPGQKATLFVLDELAAMGRLKAVEDAYGLMAGMGLQLLAVLQDLSQLQRLYHEGWQTFMANSGVIQVFGTRDLMTAEYVSKLVGVTTRTVRSTSENWGTNSSTSSSPQGFSSSSGSSRGGGINHAPTQRPLLFPDELMRMPKEAQILLVENANPILARKIVYHEDARYKGLASPRKESRA